MAGLAHAGNADLAKTGTGGQPEQPGKEKASVANANLAHAGNADKARVY